MVENMWKVTYESKNETKMQKIYWDEKWSREREKKNQFDCFVYEKITVHKC